MEFLDYFKDISYAYKLSTDIYYYIKFKNPL